MKASAMTDQQAGLGLEGRELVHLGRDNCGDADSAQDLFHRPPSRRPRASAWSGSQLKELAVVAMVSELVGSEKSAVISVCHTLRLYARFPPSPLSLLTESLVSTT